MVLTQLSDFKTHLPPGMRGKRVHKQCSYGYFCGAALCAKSCGRPSSLLQPSSQPRLALGQRSPRFHQLRSQRLDLLLGPLGPLESVLERGRAHLARDNAVILANFGGDLARLLCRSLGMVFYTDVRSESQWRRMTMVSRV